MLKPIILQGDDLTDNYRVHTLSSMWGNCFLIETSSSLFLIDTLEPGNAWRILRTCKKIGKRLKLIIITHAHFDHYGNADLIQKKTGAKIAVHKHDADMIRRGKSEIKYVFAGGVLGKLLASYQHILWNTPETEPDIIFDEGYRLDHYGLHAVMLHLPGHTSGHSGLFLESKYMFVSDLVVVQPIPLIQCYYSNDWNELLSSFERLKRIKPDLIFTGFGKPLKMAAINRIFIKHIKWFARRQNKE